MNLRGKAALVTGAAHRVGRSLALALADHGCNVGLHFHQSGGEAARTAQEIAARGVRVFPVQADLRHDSGIAALFQAVDREFSTLDILVQSAAVLEPVDLLAATPEDWSRTIDLNLRSLFFCLQQAARRMQTGGAIVNISDQAALRPWRHYPIHSISKAGVEMLTRVAALALAPAIRVNAVAPGPVLKPTALADDRWARIGRSLPLGRAGSPDDVARAMIFLLENEYITGETVVVDGGDQLPRP